MSEDEMTAAEGDSGAAEPSATPPTEGPAAARGVVRENRRKVREGLVVSTAMEKTAVVAVTERVRHPRYAKTVQRTRKLYVHDEDSSASAGDRVRVAETRPYSKTKRWRLVEILERAR